METICRRSSSPEFRVDNPNYRWNRFQQRTTGQSIGYSAELVDSTASQGRRLVINIGGQKFGSQILGGQKFFENIFSLKMYKFTSFSLYFSFFLSVSAFFNVYFF